MPPLLTQLWSASSRKQTCKHNSSSNSLSSKPSICWHSNKHRHSSNSLLYESKTLSLQASHPIMSHHITNCSNLHLRVTQNLTKRNEVWLSLNQKIDSQPLTIWMYESAKFCGTPRSHPWILNATLSNSMTSLTSCLKLVSSTSNSVTRPQVVEANRSRGDCLIIQGKIGKMLVSQVLAISRRLCLQLWIKTNK